MQTAYFFIKLSLWQRILVAFFAKEWYNAYIIRNLSFFEGSSGKYGRQEANQTEKSRKKQGAGSKSIYHAPGILRGTNLLFFLRHPDQNRE